MPKVLVTGCAGFIGFHLCQRLLLDDAYSVVGVDNLSPYYEVSLKQDRLLQLEGDKKFVFKKIDLADRELTADLFHQHNFDIVVHLAAQAGVRYSIDNPYAYVDSNLVAFANILEGCRHSSELKHFVFASSSSVYGSNQNIPFSTKDAVDHPVSLYAATKRANELMAYTYSHLYNLPTTGLRFFTVYGPWYRPDMALFLFTKAILAGEPIKVFNHGRMKRDFTYIDDVVEGIIRVMHRQFVKEPGKALEAETDNLVKSVPHKIYNIGNHQPVELIHLIEVLEDCLSKKAIKNCLPMQPGDVMVTYADVTDLMEDVGFQPDTPIEVGVRNFVEWYRSYYTV